MSSITRRVALTAIGTGVGAVAFGAPRISAATISQASFAGDPRIRAAVVNSWTGVWSVGRLQTGPGAVNTLVLVVAGQVTEVHAKRNLTYLPKQPGAISRQTIAPASYQRLIDLAGGEGNNVRATPREQAFLAELNGHGSTGRPPISGGSRPTCPAAFAQMGPHQRELIRRAVEANNPNFAAYRGCFVLSQAEPGWSDSLGGLFGAGPALAVADRLVYFTISPDNFFSSWAIEYNPQGGYYGFNVLGVRAIWEIGGG